MSGLFVGRVWMLLVGLAISALAARLLTTADLAAWFTLTAFVTIAAGVAELGAVQDAIRRIASSPNHLRHVARSSGRLVALGVATTSAVVALVGPWLFDLLIDRSGWRLLLLVLSTIVVLSAQRWLSGLALGLGRPGTSQAIEGLVGRTIFVVTLATLFFAHDGSLELETALLIQIATVVPALVIGVVAIRRVAGVPGDAPDSVVTLSSSWRLGATRGITLFQSVGDVIVVSAVLSNAETADFGVAWRLAILVAMPQQVINTIAQHRLRQERTTGGLAAAAEAARSFAAVSTAAGCVVFFALAAAGPTVLSTFFGEGFDDAYVPLVILALGQLLNVTVGPVGNFLIAADRDREVLIGAILGVSLLVVLVASLGAAWGTPGAAAGSAAATVCVNAFWWSQARRLGHRTDVFAGVSRSSIRRTLR